ncbi:pyridoxal-dependent decarboxylase [Lentzea sp. E54]|uniref:pyridoxal-dependent decarboxylase n=1 Tax=Lentzea xerophila TaxID=3435883 RepID=UPI003DA2E6E9
MAELIRQATRGDVSPARNLGTFVPALPERDAEFALDSWAGHNLINRAEYAGLTTLENHCVAMLKDLWHDAGRADGCSTSGSSEAAMITASAFLRGWRDSGGTDRPNLVLGPTAHLCWLRFCAFWDVEPRVLPLRPDHPVMNPADVADACDAGTIGVVATLGCPELGLYDPVGDIAAVLDGLCAGTGLDIPLHVDAASGGFVAPFLQPGLVWDFRLPRVASINASGHKYGLTRPSVGWLLWRRQDSAMARLSLGAPYIGTGAPEPTLSFSRSAVPVLEQYLHLMRRGRDGYTAVHSRSRAIAEGVARQLAGASALRVLGAGTDLPVVSFTAADPGGTAVVELAALLAEDGWHVPVYRLREPMAATETGRIVIRADLTTDLAEQLTTDVERALTKLNEGRTA